MLLLLGRFLGFLAAFSVGLPISVSHEEHGGHLFVFIIEVLAQVSEAIQVCLPVHS